MSVLRAAAPRNLGRKRGVAEIDRQPFIAKKTLVKIADTERVDQERAASGNEPGDGDVRVIYSRHRPKQGDAALIVAGT